MAQEEHTQKCSNSGSGCIGVGVGVGVGGGGGSSGCSSGGGGRSSKRLKQKKVPQRGLGVAQLEKIRLEEQQKKDASLHAQQAASILSPNAIISPNNSSSSCLAAVQCHNFRPSVSSSSIQFPSPNDLPSSNSLFRPSPSMPNISLLHTNQVTLSKALNVVGGGGAVVGWSAMPYPGPKLWNGSYNLEGENQKLDHHGLSIRSNVHLPYESNTSVLPLPTTLMQRSQQFQQLSSASMVNVSSGIYASSSSVLNFQMEPPSNQSYRGNNYAPLWPEEEKMVGLKRQYPFSLEIPPAPPFHGKLPSTLVDPFARSDESASCSNGSPANVETSNPLMREGPSSLHPLPEPNPRKVIQENSNLDGDFLTLAPPATGFPYLNSKHKHPLANSGPSSRELSISSQDHSEDHMQRPGASGLNGQPFFSFLPSANVQIGQAANPTRNCNSKVGGSVDLNLKL